MKKLFLFFWILLLPVSLYFIYQFVTNISVYQRLKISAPARIEEWKIEELREGKFSIIANYHYQFEENRLSGKSVFQKTFLNPDSAYHYLKRLANQEWVVWLNPYRPKESSLEKNFPIAEALRAILSIAIFIYFLILKQYLQRKFYP